jgi:hypothetical protein
VLSWSVRFVSGSARRWAAGSGSANSGQYACWSNSRAPSIRAARGFLREQLLTARNIHGNWFIDLMYGGLNYQIEHMQGIAYCETSLVQSWGEIVPHFGGVSRALGT